MRSALLYRRHIFAFLCCSLAVFPPTSATASHDNAKAVMVAVRALLRPVHGHISTTFGSIGMPFWDPVFPDGTAIGTSKVALWKYGKKNAVTISYDDSAIGNALYGVPEMAAKGLVGTWFVNPGTSQFQKMATVWHQAVSVYHQEIANHTMNHAGGTTEAEAIAAIDDASRYIKEHIYKLSPVANTLLGFNKAGGTNWDIPTDSEAWNQRIRDHYLFERKYSTGFYKAMPFEEMKMVMKAAALGSAWSSIHFHGICDDDNDGLPNTNYGPSYLEICTCTHIPPTGCGEEPQESGPDFETLYHQWAQCRFSAGYANATAVNDCRDGGVGAVKKSEIVEFYNYLVDVNEIPARQTWIAGFVEAQKYAVARQNSVVTVIETGNDRILLDLSLASVSLPPPINQVSLYDEELTVYTKVPDHWQACKVTQAGVSHTYIIDGAEVRFELVPNLGAASLENDSAANIDIRYVGYPH